MDSDELRWGLYRDSFEGLPRGYENSVVQRTSLWIEICESTDIEVIWDAVQSFGATHHGRPSGALSQIGGISFFLSKSPGGYGDGGAIFTEDGDSADKMRWIHVHGQEKKHFRPIIGINGRLDSLQAEIVFEKLKIFEDEMRLREEVASRYESLLRDLPLTLPSLSEGNTSVYAQ